MCYVKDYVLYIYLSRHSVSGTQKHCLNNFSARLIVDKASVYVWILNLG
jgi:hypothetical protein